MKTLARLAVLVVCASALVGLSPGSASANQDYDPNVARIANPANACKGIVGSAPIVAEFFGAPAPDLSGFSHSECVRTLAQGEALTSDGSPYEQCDFLVAQGVISYGMTLHSGEDDPMFDALLPDLTINNRKQCGSALYAYHTIFTLLGPPPQG